MSVSLSSWMNEDILSRLSVAFRKSSAVSRATSWASRSVCTRPRWTGALCDSSWTKPSRSAPRRRRLWPVTMATSARPRTACARWRRACSRWRRRCVWWRLRGIGWNCQVHNAPLNAHLSFRFSVNLMRNKTKQKAAVAVSSVLLRHTQVT